jgi:hypothetical protein
MHFPTFPKLGTTLKKHQFTRASGISLPTLEKLGATLKATPEHSCFRNAFSNFSKVGSDSQEKHQNTRASGMHFQTFP